MVKILAGYLNGENVQAFEEKSSYFSSQNPTALNSELAENRYLHTSAINYMKTDISLLH